MFDRKNIPVLLHISAWVLMGMILFLIAPLSWKVNLPYQFWIRQGILLLLLVSVFYINMHYLVPRYLFKKGQIWAFLGIGLGLAFLLMLAIQRIEIAMHLPQLMHRAFKPDVPYVPKGRSFAMDIFTFLVVLLSLGISTSVAAVQKWQLDESLRRQLEEERVNSELSYLKAQINPHFFFNTLNNIYALTGIDTERARMALHTLSRMMRYVLYETEKNRTLLSREIDFIKDFVVLMKQRISEKVQVDLHIQENFSDQFIAPMLLLPFIENCFKHGISSRQPSTIRISLTLENHLLHLKTVNKIIPSSKNSIEAPGSGIGLSNTQRRLDLLYAGRYELITDDQNAENEYRVDLKIDLR